MIDSTDRSAAGGNHSQPDLRSDTFIRRVLDALEGVAFEFLSDARRLVAPEIVPPGLWDVMEFSGAFDRLEQDRLVALFQQAVEAANRDEVVAKVLVRVLAERGLITQDGRMRFPMPASQDAAIDDGDEPQDEPKIWTPESEAAQKGKGKIWLPS